MTKDFPHASLTYSSPYTPEGMTSPAHIKEDFSIEIPEAYASPAEMIKAFVYIKENLQESSSLGVDYRTRYAHSIAGDPSKTPSDHVDVLRHLNRLSSVLEAAIERYRDGPEFTAYVNVRVRDHSPRRVATALGWTEDGVRDVLVLLDSHVKKAMEEEDLI